MDGKQVQSYIKRHVLPKLDSLPTDVQSVKNAFDTWRKDWTTARAARLDNLDATISSRASSLDVDDVRGGVDTTLQRLEELEGSVRALQDGLAIVDSVVNGVEGITLWAKESQTVNGSGYILGLRNEHNSSDVKFSIDSKQCGQHIRARFGWFCLPYMIRRYPGDSYYLYGVFKTGDGLINFLDSEALVYVSGDSFIEEMLSPNFITTSLLDSGTFRIAGFYGLAPIRFSSSFSTGARTNIIYTLDPT